MKREFAIAGIALVVSILLSSPSLAQTAPAKAEPASVASTATEDTIAVEEISLDDAILLASSPEDMKRLMMRCAGPPPQLRQNLATLTPSQPEG